ncbi:23S rRNA (guanosine(2251)-2'-O)-methyltransferase RlmB [Prosthecomicrobium hirschii]|uniref:TrmH family RNA methyltransferase n=1 Tax=Prosthecodimorpha hirschii TaxID=665126 RepID=UPI0011278D96|nr:RNA methyltransferase [Prosthecomicrobium hirschii]TPQ52108.1 23S rRNA (guanosine(2251)-2'-O)-methyltransferase RlmB [Prosthecomicrobium hirschii]
MTEDHPDKPRAARPGRRPSKPPVAQRRRTGGGNPAPEGRVFLYGLHPVEMALANPDRVIHAIYVTRNAEARLRERGLTFPVEPQQVEPRWIDARVGADTVHQGVLVETETLTTDRMSALRKARLVLALDQVTDPHNVGAVMRSAVALGADALLTTTRHSPEETGVLAKSASGAVDLLTHVEVVNLARTLNALRDEGFTVIGLDSDGPEPIEAVRPGARTVLVLGSEGKGLRPITRDACDQMVRLDMPGPIKSLNVSNAAVLALYLVGRAMPAADGSA